MNYTERARAAAVHQFPSLPAGLLNSLPIDDAPTGNVYLAQTGGFTMVLSCRDRGLTEEGGVFFVGDAREGMEDTSYYEGPSLRDALAVLTA